jgi:hypothetical protein
MRTTNNMINLFTVILVVFIIYIGLMCFYTDINAIVLMSISLVGILVISLFAKTFFEKYIKEQDFTNIFIDYYIDNELSNKS